MPNFQIENTLVHKRLNTAGAKRVLVLSGGGVRGLITLGMLKKVEDELKVRESQLGRDPERFRLSDYFDLIGGTSTGAILATLLALGKTVDEITATYEEMIPQIFKPWFRIPLLQPQFRAPGLVRAIDKIFDEVLVKANLEGKIPGWEGVKSPTLGSKLLKTGLILVSKRIDTHSIWALSNNPRVKYWHPETPEWEHIYQEDNDTAFFPNRDYPLRKVVQASASAPYYLNAVHMDIEPDQTGLFLDGGASPLNNPAREVFLMTTLKAHDETGGNGRGLSPFGFGWETGKDKIFMLSLGTGTWRDRIDVNKYRRKVALDKAFHSLMTIIADAEVDTVTWMQAISETPDPHSCRPHYLNWNVKDMTGLSILNKNTDPLLTFRHINPTLDKGWLKDNLELDYSDRKLTKIRALINSKKKNMAQLKKIGLRMGNNNISQADFPKEFDV